MGDIVRCLSALIARQIGVHSVLAASSYKPERRATGKSALKGSRAEGDVLSRIPMPWLPLRRPWSHLFVLKPECGAVGSPAFPAYRA